MFASKVLHIENIYCTAVFRSRSELKSLHDDDNFVEQYSTSCEKIMESVEKFTRDESGWVEDGVETLEINITKYNSPYWIKVSSYSFKIT